MVIPVLLIACALSSKPQPEATPAAAPTSSPATTPSATPAGPRWVFTAGASQAYTLEHQQHAEATGAAAYTLDQTQRAELSVSVKSVDASGAATVEFRIESLRIETTLNRGKPVVVDSATPSPNVEFDPASQVRAIAGSTLTVVIGATGEVGTVTGVAELRERMKKSYAEPAEFRAVALPFLDSISDAEFASAVASFLGKAGAEPPTAVRGFGTLVPTSSAASTAEGQDLTTHRATDYALEVPNKDPVASMLDVAIDEATKSEEITVTPSAGALKSYRSTLTLKLKTTLKGRAGDKSSATQTLSQTTTLTPSASKPKEASVTPSAAGTP